MDKSDKRRISNRQWRGLCRHCEYSSWNDEQSKWDCKYGIDTKKKTECAKFYCCSNDKITGVQHRQSKCYICGKPVYSHTAETPIYCDEHRAYTDMDTKIIEEAPAELLFLLIAGIFLRARDDYIYNTDNKGSDAEVFFRGNWAQELSIRGFDAEKVLQNYNDKINADKRTDEDTE